MEKEGREQRAEISCPLHLPIAGTHGRVTHEPRMRTRLELIPVSVEYCYSPADGMLVHRRITPNTMSPVPISYTRVESDKVG